MKLYHKSMSRLVSTRKKKKRKPDYRKIILFFAVIIVIIIVAVSVHSCQQKKAAAKAEAARLAAEDAKATDSIDVELLTPNKYSRPGIALKQINGIVMHYTANPGATAMENRDYFEGLKDSHLTHASSHFIVGLDGEILQCVPLTEIAYCSNTANDYTVSIEVCHPDDTGKFGDETMESLEQLVAWLCDTFSLDPAEDVIRHYDVTGKICPKYYVENEDAWLAFRQAVSARIEEDKTANGETD